LKHYQNPIKTFERSMLKTTPSLEGCGPPDPLA
jgi:hypothetical protein